jgi:hypothetical protein
VPICLTHAVLVRHRVAQVIAGRRSAKCSSLTATTFLLCSCLHQPTRLQRSSVELCRLLEMIAVQVPALIRQVSTVARLAASHSPLAGQSWPSAFIRASLCRRCPDPSLGGERHAPAERIEAFTLPFSQRGQRVRNIKRFRLGGHTLTPHAHRAIPLTTIGSDTCQAYATHDVVISPLSTSRLACQRSPTPRRPQRPKRRAS